MILEGLIQGKASAAPDLAIGLGCNVEAALEESDDP
jgi:hypothetical protein